MSLAEVERYLQTLENGGGEAVRALISRGSLSTARVQAAAALGSAIAAVVCDYHSSYQGCTYWRRVSTGMELLKPRSVVEFSIACARRILPAWEAYELSTADALPALILAEDWFETGRPTKEQLEAEAEKADLFATRLDLAQPGKSNDLFAIAAARAFANVASCAAEAIDEAPHDAAAFVVEYSAVAAGDYVTEVAWQTRVLCGYLLLPGA